MIAPASTCAACGKATTSPGAGAIATIDGKAVTYLLCATCAAKARAEPDAVAEIVEARFRAPPGWRS